MQTSQGAPAVAAEAKAAAEAQAGFSPLSKKKKEQAKKSDTVPSRAFFPFSAKSVSTSPGKFEDKEFPADTSVFGEVSRG